MRIALVTGASRGIGKAIALSLADTETYVYINYRSGKDLAEKVVSEIQANGGQAQAIGFDVSEPDQVKEAFLQIEKEQGGIDILVNNAGLAIDQLMLRAKDEDWDRVIQTNLSSLFYCTRAALKTMIRRKNNGRIIAIGSVVGQMGNAGQAMYAASKSGMVGMIKSVCKEVGSRGITANVVAPGFVKTEMTDELTDAQKEDFLANIPLKRWAEPKEIAATVKFLCSEDAGYITGQVIGVNGGLYV